MLEGRAGGGEELEQALLKLAQAGDWLGEAGEVFCQNGLDGDGGEIGGVEAVGEVVAGLEGVGAAGGDGPHP